MANGIYASDGSIRVTFVPGTSWTGLYASDGSINAVVDDTSGNGLYHKCGAWRVNSTVVKGKIYDPSGAYYLSTLLGGRPVTSPNPFVPLPGAAVDYDFVAGAGTHSLATIMDGPHTGAIGDLATAFLSTDISILLQLKVLGANPGVTVWIACNSFSSVFSSLSDTTFRSRKIATSLNATLGSGAFSTNSCKIAFASNATGRSEVGNNGVLTTDVQTWTAGAPTFVNVDTQWSRLTVWTSRLSDVALAAFTI